MSEFRINITYTVMVDAESSEEACATVAEIMTSDEFPEELLVGEPAVHDADQVAA